MAKSRRIAALFDMNAYYNRMTYAGIREFVRNRLGWICEPLNPLTPDFKWLKDGKWDGVVAFANKDLLAFLEKWGIPCVNVSNSSPPGGKIPRVVNDDYAVGVLAAEHFLERGFRYFAFFGLDTAYVSNLRKAGFEETLAKSGHKCERFPLDLQYTKGHYMRVEIPGISARIAEGRYPIGIFAMNDDYARWVVGACANHGIGMPEQVGVLGAGNSDMSDGLAEIPFSSVELQNAKIGYTAMQVLDEMLSRAGKRKFLVKISPKGVMVRASSDLIAVLDPLVGRALKLIQERAYGCVQINDIVRLVGVSRRKLEKQFKLALGRSPYEEVLRLRTEKAKSLLADTNLPISEVAEASGFGLSKQLHAFFVKENNLTPSAYRKKFRMHQ